MDWETVASRIIMIFAYTYMTMGVCTLSKRGVKSSIKLEQGVKYRKELNPPAHPVPLFPIEAQISIQKPYFGYTIVQMVLINKTTKQGGENTRPLFLDFPKLGLKTILTIGFDVFAMLTKFLVFVLLALETACQEAGQNCTCPFEPRNATNATAEEEKGEEKIDKLDQCEMKPHGKQFCPLPSIRTDEEDCVPIPSYPSEPPIGEILYTTSVNLSPKSQCRSCSLTLTENENDDNGKARVLCPSLSDKRIQNAFDRFSFFLPQQEQQQRRINKAAPTAAANKDEKKYVEL
ncbi:hypothetical protein ABEB36_012241 [Hypothenemus hampei]|uniref:Uncharacterized protein n=1 Tax=Hypothenemus hampei TaxID=57062 RepID=A0ABD1EAI7_HYPHA